MRLALSLAASLLAAACAEQQIRVSPAASRALGSPEDACRTASAEIPAFADGGVLDLAEAPALSLEPRERPRPVFEGKPLLPPERAGEPELEVQGCLAAERTAAAGARYPAAAERPRDLVRVNPLSGGLLITHELVHPCCLGAEVSAQVEGAEVRVTETLSGTPCDCRCVSRVRAAIGLAPGHYSVAVGVRGLSSEERTAYSGAATAPGK